MGHRNYLDYANRKIRGAHEFAKTIKIRDALRVPSDIESLNK